MTQNTRYAYTVIVPQHGADYAEQAADIAAQTRAWLQKQPADTHIVRQTVFFRDAEANSAANTKPPSNATCRKPRLSASRQPTANCWRWKLPPFRACKWRRKTTA